MDIDDRQIGFLLRRESSSVRRCRSRAAHPQALRLQKRLQCLGNVPVILHNENTGAPQIHAGRLACASKA